MNRIFLLALFTICLFTSVFGQGNNSGSDNSTSLNTGISAVDSLFVYTDSSATIKKKRSPDASLLTQVINRAQRHAIELSQIKIQLTESQDTTEMSEELPKIKLMADRIASQMDRDKEKLNLRYLQGIENLIALVKDLNDKFESKVEDRVQRLTAIGNNLEKIKSDSLFNLTLRDTSLIPSINKELALLKNSINTIDSIYLAKEITTAKFQAKISENTILFLELEQFLKANRAQMERSFWKKEINYLWQAPTYEKETSFQEVVKESGTVNLQLLKAYLEKTYMSLIVCLIILILGYLKIKAIIKAVSNEKEFAKLILDRVKYFKNHTFASTLIILLPIFLIIFSTPPLVFISTLSLLLVFASTFLVKEQFGNYFKKIWWVFLLPYVFLALSGLHWKVAFQERWYILISSLLFILMGILVLKHVRRHNLKGAQVLQPLAIFLIAFQSFAALANIFGRFNIAKTYSVTGAILFFRGVCLFLFIYVLLELVYLLIEYSKNEKDSFTSYFDFQDLQKRMQGLLIVFACGIWIYGLFWHLGYYNYIYDSFVLFLSKDRILGATTFQFGSILLFLVILYVTTFLANNIAYFASVKDQRNATSRKQRLGSSVLLIRLGVLMIGFFIGMTAAKIPFDRIAIVLGALSVGIGFGLQTIINNLVSGIILAFERPIQIGDEIQVGELSGTVKDVGIRASKIQAYDGSEIVMPNGDLLSKSLINWTLSDKKRRVELIIGVGYGSDMKQVKTILEEVVSGDRILKAPAPRVYMQTFNDSSVDFRVLFWVESMDIWIDVRAEVMSAIFEKFAEHDIEIPFPKRDLYLKSVPSNWQEKVSKPGEDISPTSNQIETKDVSDTAENKKSSEE